MIDNFIVDENGKATFVCRFDAILCMVREGKCVTFYITGGQLAKCNYMTADKAIEIMNGFTAYLNSKQPTE